jgi:hypothetical protein
VPNASAVLNKVALLLELIHRLSALYTIGLDATVCGEAVAAEKARGRCWRIRVRVHGRVTLEGGITGRARIGFEGVGVLEDGAIHFTEGVAIIDDGFPEGLAARELAVWVIEAEDGVDVAVVAAMWDATRVLLIGVEVSEVTRA